MSKALDVHDPPMDTDINSQTQTSTAIPTDAQSRSLPNWMSFKQNADRLPLRPHPSYFLAFNNQPKYHNLEEALSADTRNTRIYHRAGDSQKFTSDFGDGLETSFQNGCRHNFMSDFNNNMDTSFQDSCNLSFHSCLRQPKYQVNKNSQKTSNFENNKENYQRQRLKIFAGTSCSTFTAKTNRRVCSLVRSDSSPDIQKNSSNFGMKTRITDPKKIRGNLKPMPHVTTKDTDCSGKIFQEHDSETERNSSWSCNSSAQLNLSGYSVSSNTGTGSKFMERQCADTRNITASTDIKLSCSKLYFENSGSRSAPTASNDPHYSADKPSPETNVVSQKPLRSNNSSITKRPRRPHSTTSSNSHLINDDALRNHPFKKFDWLMDPSTLRTKLQRTRSKPKPPRAEGMLPLLSAEPARESSSTKMQRTKIINQLLDETPLNPTEKENCTGSVVEKENAKSHVTDDRQREIKSRKPLKPLQMFQTPIHSSRKRKKSPENTPAALKLTFQKEDLPRSDQHLSKRLKKSDTKSTNLTKTKGEHDTVSIQQQLLSLTLESFLHESAANKSKSRPISKPDIHLNHHLQDLSTKAKIVTHAGSSRTLTEEYSHPFVLHNEHTTISHNTGEQSLSSSLSNNNHKLKERSRECHLASLQSPSTVSLKSHNLTHTAPHSVTSNRFSSNTSFHCKTSSLDDHKTTKGSCNLWDDLSLPNNSSYQQNKVPEQRLFPFSKHHTKLCTTLRPYNHPSDLQRDDSPNWKSQSHPLQGNLGQETTPDTMTKNQGTVNGLRYGHRRVVHKLFSGHILVIECTAPSQGERTYDLLHRQPRLEQDPAVTYISKSRNEPSIEIGRELSLTSKDNSTRQKTTPLKPVPRYLCMQNSGHRSPCSHHNTSILNSRHSK